MTDLNERPNCYHCDRPLQKHIEEGINHTGWGFHGNGFFCSQKCGLLAAERLLGELEMGWYAPEHQWLTGGG